MTLSPVRPAKTYETVAERIREAILAGEFAPGSRLPSVRALSERLGVGQASVREALMALQAVQLVTIRQGDGTFVNRFTPEQVGRVIDETPVGPEDLAHLLELRKILEAGTARLAALRRTPDHLARLDALLKRMREELEIPDAGEQTDFEFHYEIARAAGNPFLLRLMDISSGKIRNALRASRLELYRLPGEPEKLVEQHVGLCEAIAAGDGEAARERLLAHLAHVEAALGLGVLIP